MSASVKTAISLQQHLFDHVNGLAKELNVSRSKLFVLAIEEFIKKDENKKMLAAINASLNDASDDDLDNEDNKNLKAMKKKHVQILEKEPW